MKSVVADLYSSLALLCLHCHAQKEKKDVVKELNVYLMSTVPYHCSSLRFNVISTHHSCNMVMLYHTAYLKSVCHCVNIRLSYLFVVIYHEHLIHGNTTSM